MVRPHKKLAEVDSRPQRDRLTRLGLFVLALAACCAGCVSAPPSALPTATAKPTVTAVPKDDLTTYPWVFLRGEPPSAEDEHLVSLIAVGDVFPGRGVAGEPDPLRYTAGWLPHADLVLGNLEGVLVDSGTPRGAPEGNLQPIILRASPGAADYLAGAGFSVLNLANNHGLDYGTQGLDDTLDALDQAGLGVIGVRDSAQRGPPLIRAIDGLRVAFLAYTAVPDPHPEQVCSPSSSCTPRPAVWDPITAPREISAARDQADAVVVSIHWGFEYQSRPDPGQEAIAKAMLAAGSDLVVGHHPHVVQPLSVFGDQVVAYSLGNFLFDQSDGKTAQGLAVRAFFDKDGLRAVQAVPLAVGRKPQLLPAQEAQTWLTPLLPPLPRIAFACSEENCVPAAAPPGERGGSFYGGQIDLTGDGLPETIRLAEERIAVYEQGEAVWRSPQAWRVADAALGDANDDGRYEVMLAIWQDDNEGYARSQPYIIGYRGGRYRLLWGGRPVANPLQEVALGDVDGDSRQELVVIEQMAGSQDQAISVWRWAGWTYSLMWRSLPGRYADLQLLERDGRNLISVSDSKE